MLGLSSMPSMPVYPQHKRSDLSFAGRWATQVQCFTSFPPHGAFSACRVGTAGFLCLSPLPILSHVFVQHERECPPCTPIILGCECPQGYL